jgi:AMP deaminase
MSDDALLEEYSVARASFDLSMTDMMEMARNSILQSGFEHDFKKKWLGESYEKGVTFCDEVRLVSVLCFECPSVVVHLYILTT